MWLVTSGLPRSCGADENGDLMLLHGEEQLAAVGVDGKEEPLLRQLQMLAAVVRDEAVETKAGLRGRVGGCPAPFQSRLLLDDNIGAGCDGAGSPEGGATSFSAAAAHGGRKRKEADVIGGQETPSGARWWWLWYRRRQYARLECRLDQARLEGKLDEARWRLGSMRLDEARRLEGSKQAPWKLDDSSRLDRTSE